MSKQRIIDLQKQVKIARAALSDIAHGGLYSAESRAIVALDEMEAHDAKKPLQGLCGHAARPRPC